MFLDQILQYIALHHTIAYITLFLGSYFEALIGTSFFVPGEIFFIAGSVAAGMGSLSIWVVALLFYAGGILGDHSSYLIGRIWGDRFYQVLKRQRLFAYFLKNDLYGKANRFFKKYGGWSVLTARFLGPAAWVTPFLAGTFKLPYRQFVLFDIPAVILGIGQFIFVGYFFGAQYQSILRIVQQYMLIIGFIVIIGLFLYFRFRKMLNKKEQTTGQWLWSQLLLIRNHRLKFLSHTIRESSVIAVVIILLYSIALFGVFFIAYQELSKKAYTPFQYTFASEQSILKKIKTTLYYYRGSTNIQPINAIIITNIPIQKLLTDAHWVYIPSFRSDKVTIGMYLKLLKERTLPVSDLFFDGVPQGYAYQADTISLLKREHIRVWRFGELKGKQVYLISASEDAGIDIYRSLSFFVLYHGVVPNVDKSRSVFTTSLINTYGTKKVHIQLVQSFVPQAPKVTPSEEQKEDPNYYTDNKIAVIKM